MHFQQNPTEYTTQDLEMQESAELSNAKSRATHFELKAQTLKAENQRQEVEIKFLKSENIKLTKQLEKLENEKRDKADKARAMKLVKSVYVWELISREYRNKSSDISFLPQIHKKHGPKRTKKAADDKEPPTTSSAATASRSVFSPFDFGSTSRFWYMLCYKFVWQCKVKNKTNNYSKKFIYF